MSAVLERPAARAPAAPLLRPDARLVPWLALAAVLLRLALFPARGNYLAFDEAWYLIIARNLWTGHGFTMGGLPQIALSPLFPLVAGGLGRLLGSYVWAGRIVGALASGLLVLPCWSLFRRLAGARTALLACALVAALPALAPFVAPELVGWDLWVGAGPLGQLFGLTGIALLLAGLDGGARWRWPLAGAAFALAYLDRPEAFLVAVLAGGGALALGGWRRLPRLALPALAGGAALLLVASPYLVYLHGALGRWSLTGRGVDVRVRTVRQTAGGRQSVPSATVEQMLWRGEQQRYAEELYQLDSSDVRMANGYWGRIPKAAPPRSPVAPPATPSPAAAVPAAPRVATSPAVKAAPTEEPLPPAQPPSRLERASYYLRALGMLLPWPLWPFALAGLILPGRRRWRRELAVFGPLAGPAAAIAAMIAVDPRTQLLLAPALAWYAARGLTLLAAELQRRWRGGVRRGFAFLAVAGTAVAVLIGIDGYRLWAGATDESIRQVIADANREVGTELERLVPGDATIMSWSPAVAVWARRDWRPLPTATLPRVLRFAEATGTRWVVFSTLNPSPLARAQMPRVFLIASVPAGASAAAAWRIDVTRFADQYAVGRVVPVSAGASP